MQFDSFSILRSLYCEILFLGSMQLNVEEIFCKIILSVKNIAIRSNRNYRVEYEKKLFKKVILNYSIA